MARPPAKREFLLMWHAMTRRRLKFIIVLSTLMLMIMLLIRRRRRRIHREPCWYDPIIRSTHLRNMISRSDLLCVEQLRMDRRCFRILCSLVREYGGLKDTRNMSVEEMVAMFLHIIAYDEKNREIKFDFQRSQETISRQFHNVLRAILKLWKLLLRTPQPIPDDCSDNRWKWFKVKLT